MPKENTGFRHGGAVRLKVMAVLKQSLPKILKPAPHSTCVASRPLHKMHNLPAFVLAPCRRQRTERR
jgi:hypothetical protein